MDRQENKEEKNEKWKSDIPPDEDRKEDRKNNANVGDSGLDLKANYDASMSSTSSSSVSSSLSPDTSFLGDPKPQYFADEEKGLWGDPSHNQLYETKTESKESLNNTFSSFSSLNSIGKALANSSTWVCEECTFENTLDAANCVMCLSKRPVSSDQSNLADISEGIESKEEEEKARVAMWENKIDPLQMALDQSELMELDGCPQLRPTVSLLGRARPEERSYVEEFIPTEEEQSENEKIKKQMIELGIEFLDESKERGAGGKVNVIISTRQVSEAIDNTWTCTACEFANPPEAPICAICETACPNANDFFAVDVGSVIGSNEWICSACTLINDTSSNVCSMCNSPQPADVREKLKSRQQKPSSQFDQDGTIQDLDVRQCEALACEHEENFNKIGKQMGEFVFLDSEPIINLISFALTQLREDDAESDRYYQPILEATSYRATVVAELRGFLTSPKMKEKIMSIVYQDQHVQNSDRFMKRLNPLVYVRIFNLARAIGSIPKLEKGSASEPNNHPPLNDRNTMVASIDSLMQASIEQEHAMAFRTHGIFVREQEFLLKTLKAQENLISRVHTTVANHLVMINREAGYIMNPKSQNMSMFREAINLVCLRDDDIATTIINHAFLSMFASQCGISQIEAAKCLRANYSDRHFRVLQLGSVENFKELQEASRRAFLLPKKGLVEEGIEGSHAFGCRIRKALELIPSDRHYLLSEKAKKNGERNEGVSHIFKDILQDRIDNFLEMQMCANSLMVQEAGLSLSKKMDMEVLEEANEESRKKTDEMKGLTHEQKRHLVNEGYYMLEDKMMAKNRAYLTGRYDQVVMKRDSDVSKKDKKEKKQKKDKKEKMDKKDKKDKLGLGASLASLGSAFDDFLGDEAHGPVSNTEGLMSLSEEKNMGNDVEEESYVDQMVKITAYASREKSVRKVRIKLYARIIKLCKLLQKRDTDQSRESRTLHYLHAISLRLGLTSEEEMIASHMMEKDIERSETHSRQLDSLSMDDLEQDEVILRMLTGMTVRIDAVHNAYRNILSHFESYGLVMRQDCEVNKIMNAYLEEGFINYCDFQNESVSMHPDQSFLPVQQCWFAVPSVNILETIEKIGFRRELKKLDPTISNFHGLTFYTNIDALLNDFPKIDYVILANVAPGVPTSESKNSWPGFRIPNEGLTYDSYVDNFNTPQRFVIFDDFQALPMFSVNMKQVVINAIKSNYDGLHGLYGKH